MELKLRHNFKGLVKSFERAPKETKKMVHAQLKMAVRDIKESAAEHHNYTSRSGTLEREGLVTFVRKNVGVVALNPRVPYAVFVHEGSKPHIIKPAKKIALRWESKGKFVFAKSVKHPGTKKDPFLYDAAQREWPKIQSRFDNMLDSLLKEL